MASSLPRCCCTSKLRSAISIPTPHPCQNYIFRQKHDVQKKQRLSVNVKSLFREETSTDNPLSSSISVLENKRKPLEHVSTYQRMMNHCKDQALRSVLIRVPSSQAVPFDALSEHGIISKAFYYQGDRNYMLVEFKNMKSIKGMLEKASYFPDPGQMPIQSRLLYAKYNSRVNQQRRPLPSFLHTVCEKHFMQDQCLAADSVSSQMKDLHEARSLSDVGSRLRYFICTIVEDMLRTSLPHCRVDPFGSSSNGFGWESSDLDMMLTLMAKHQQKGQVNFWFLTKRHAEDERSFTQQCLDVVGDMIRVLMPCSYQVSKILNARVPIVKFRHEITDVECDLTCANLSGTKMSELMFLMGEMDSRVRLLMTTIKQWAKSCEVTRSHPGPWPSNFMLLSLLIFFLQTRSVPVLPSVRHLQTLAEPGDHFQIDDVDYAFVTDVRKVIPSKNKQTPEELLIEFFHFYAHFDFETQGMSLIEGTTFPKPDSAAVFIDNPLEVGHNITRNVSPAHAAKLKDSMLQAVCCLEAKSVPRKDAPWGLTCLFQPPVSSEKTRFCNLLGLFAEDARDVL